MASSQVYNVSLETYPRVNYPALVAAVTQDSASRLNGHIAGGLEATGLTKANHTWLAFNNGVVAARYVNDAPQMFAGNAGHAGTKAYDIAAQLHIGIIEALASIKRSILAALGPTISSELQNADGVITQSTQAIMQFLHDNYGIPSEDDIKHVKSKLREKFASDSVVYSGAIKHGQLFAQLAAMGQAENGASKMAYFEDAISDLPASVAALMQYKSTTLFGRRDIVAMYTFVRNNYGNFTATMHSQGYVNAAVSNVPPTTRINVVPIPATIAIDPTVAALTALVHTLLADKQSNANSNKSSSQRAGNGHGVSNHKHKKTYFCNYHGTNYTHNGSECKYMADPSRGFSDEQRAKKSA